MSTLAWVLIFVSLLLIRAVSRGRVMNLGEDLSDAFIAIASGKTDDLAAVLARTGDATTPTSATVTGMGDAPVQLAPGAGQSRDTPDGTNAAILSEAMRLGKAAKGYRLTATGPTYYDCSGLVWRACQAVGFKGIRFTTATIKLSHSFVKTANPVSGDIVLWPGHHMGIVTTPGRFYSARSPRSGISEAPIKGFGPFNESPEYLRYVKS